MALILIVDDEADLQSLLEYNLKLAGHEVVAALNGAEGLRLAYTRMPDVLVLDVMLPDLMGTDICQTLKRDKRTKAIPILMLTARAQEADRVRGLELGADDYVVKPFSLRELILRIGAILKRKAGPAGDEVAEHGLIRLDKSGHQAWVAGLQIDGVPKDA